MRKILAIACLLTLCNCSTIDALLNPSPNVVSTMEASLAAAISAATPYVSLDSCLHVGHTLPCRDPTVTRNIDKARIAATVAVTAAESNLTASNIQAAQNAINAYQAIAAAVQ